MAKDIFLDIEKEEHFNKLLNGKSRLMICIGHNNNIVSLRKGDTITSVDHEEYKFNIIRSAVYENFERMLQTEDLAKTLSSLQPLYEKGEFYSNHTVYVIELQYYPGKMKCRVASDLMNSDRQAFSQFISDSYNITDHFSSDYPNHFEWFYQKALPGVFSGEREIIACYADEGIAGIAILKKVGKEQKICTFYVEEKFRKQGIGNQLLQESFKWLGTTTPTIFISSGKVAFFAKIIQKYGWKHTETAKDNSGFVYNGRLT
jgi:hypothetical protein